MIAGIVAGFFGIILFLIFGALALAAFVFWIWMLIHAITNKGLNDTEKIIWVLVVIFLHFLGALLYFFLGKPKGTAAVA
jgi:hypothetical protein